VGSSLLALGGDRGVKGKTNLEMVLMHREVSEPNSRSSEKWGWDAETGGTLKHQGESREGEHDGLKTEGSASRQGGLGTAVGMRTPGTNRPDASRDHQ